jgi:hypothetical protein
MAPINNKQTERGSMPVLRDIPVAIDAQEIIADQRQRRHRPDMLRRAAEAIETGQDLWRPVVVYEWFTVEGIDGQRVFLGRPSQPEWTASLHVGPKVDLLEEAHRILIGVGTIGPSLEEEVERLQRSGEHLEAYLLDSAGVVALGAAGESFRCLAEDTATALGWGVSAALSPGSLVGWPLRGQKELCALLPLDEIGVKLNRHCVLEPHKSVSAVIGLGPGYDSAHVGSVCKYCALQDTCWRKREEAS